MKKQQIAWLLKSPESVKQKKPRKQRATKRGLPCLLCRRNEGTKT